MKQDRNTDMFIPCMPNSEASLLYASNKHVFLFSGECECDSHILKKS